VVPPVCRGAAVDVIDRPPPKRLRRSPPGGRRWWTGGAGSTAAAGGRGGWGRALVWARRLFGGLGGVAAAGSAAAATLPEDKAEALFHVYDGGGVKADGPALLLRKSLGDRVSLAAQVYVDAVSNASVDVVTTASPFKEKRTAWDLGADWLVRDSLVSLGWNKSTEPDYVAEAFSLDVAHDVFGGMTTVALGFTRAKDLVGEKGVPGWIDTANHWQYRLGLTQVLSAKWIASANVEIVSDSGFLGSPYRVARVFGASEPERNPRTRTSRAVKLRSVVDTGALLPRSALRAEYRYFWDTWAIKAHTVELGGSRYVGERFLVDAALRTHRQGKALFYSDDAPAVTLYNSRNRQLSTFGSTALQARVTYTVPGMRPGWDLKLSGSYELKRFRFDDFTDLRSGALYRYDAHVWQFGATATF
jgi:hypothetical protein